MAILSTSGKPNNQAFNLSFFFEDTYGAGWTETFHVTSALSQSSAQTIFNAYAPLRMALSPPSVGLLRARFEGAYNRTPMIIKSATSANVLGTYNTGTQTEQMPAEIGIKARLFNSQGFHNTILIRGIPEAKSTGEFDVTDSAWDTAFTALGNYLIGEPTFCLETTLLGAAKWMVVVNASHTTPKGITLTIQTNDPMLTEGTLVQLHNLGTPGYKGMKRVYTAPVPLGALFSVGLSGANPKIDPPPGTTGYYSVPEYTQYPIGFVKQDGQGHRKVGRPFYQPVGREPTTFSLRP